MRVSNKLRTANHMTTPDVDPAAYEAFFGYPMPQPSGPSGDTSDKDNRQIETGGGSDGELVLKTLRDCMDDPNAPMSARVQAARTMAEIKLLLGRNQREQADQGTPVAELTRAQMEAELKALEGG